MTEQNDSTWYGDLSDAPELSEWVQNKGFTDPKAALNSYYNTEKLLGADRAGRTVVLPKDENDKDGLAAFRSKIGVPEKPEEYGLPVPEGHSEDFAKWASTVFHEAGIPKGAAATIAEKWNGYFSELLANQAKEDQLRSEQALDELRKEWGDAFGQKSEFGRRGLKAYGSQAGLDENDLNALEQSIGTAKMLKLFHALGETTKETDFAGGDKSGFTMTPAEAQSKLDEARKKRLANEISEKDFMAIMDRYGPVASKEAA